jgi:hypothetical protein
MRTRSIDRQVLWINLRVDKPALIDVDKVAN